jgi:flagellar motor switch protein FliN/FliY
MAEEEKQQNQGEKSQEELAKEWEEALKQQELQQQKEASSEEDITSAWEEALKEQQASSASSEEGKDENCSEEKFELLKDIPLEVTIEVGSASLPLEEVLKLHPNSIVELDRYIHEPVDIKVNGRLIAKGELYTVKDSYGIKITQIITPEERLKLLEG